MELGVELMPKRRLKDINVFEVSFVDKAANGQKFLVFKRNNVGNDNFRSSVGANGDSSVVGACAARPGFAAQTPTRDLYNSNSNMGGDHNMDNDTNDIAGHDKDNLQNAARLAELSEMLDVGNEYFRSDVVTKQGEEKIKADDDTNVDTDVGAGFKPAQTDRAGLEPAPTDDDSKYVELRKEIEGLQSMLDELRAGLPMRKGLQETEEPRPRKAGKDKLLSVMKSRELKSKMTCAHAPNPTQWAKEILQDGE